MTDAAARPRIDAVLSDMDGVIVREDRAIDGAVEFVRTMLEGERPFLLLTNNSLFTPRDLSRRLARVDLPVPPDLIWTSALATARFLDRQRPGGSAYVVGEEGLRSALLDVGYELTVTDPDYVVIGETRSYSFETMTRALRFIADGVPFIATNPDEVGPSEDGPLLATGAVTAMLERATGTAPYVVGKPNPLMVRTALRRIGAHSGSTMMVGDRMDTDVVAGMEAGLTTVLVLTGISDADDPQAFPYRPDHVVGSIRDVLDLLDRG